MTTFEIVKNDQNRIVTYEIFAPAGFHFVEGCHSFIAFSRKEAEDFKKNGIEKCPSDCDCGEMKQ